MLLDLPCQFGEFAAQAGPCPNPDDTAVCINLTSGDDAAKCSVFDMERRFCGGPGWDRTSDLPRVKRTLSH